MTFPPSHSIVISAFISFQQRPVKLPLPLPLRPMPFPVPAQRRGTQGCVRRAICLLAPPPSITTSTSCLEAEVRFCHQLGSATGIWQQPTQVMWIWTCVGRSISVIQQLPRLHQAVATGTALRQCRTHRLPRRALVWSWLRTRVLSILRIWICGRAWRCRCKAASACRSQPAPSITLTSNGYRIIGRLRPVSASRASQGIMLPTEKTLVTKALIPTALCRPCVLLFARSTSEGRSATATLRSIQWRRSRWTLWKPRPSRTIAQMRWTRWRAAAELRSGTTAWRTAQPGACRDFASPPARATSRQRLRKAELNPDIIGLHFL